METEALKKALAPMSKPSAQSLWASREKRKIEERLSRAATAGCLSLSGLFNFPFRFARSAIVETTSSDLNPPNELLRQKDSFLSVSLYIQGDLQGIAEFCFSPNDVKPILDGLPGVAGKSFAILELMKKSALEEATHLFVNALLKDLEASLHLQCYPSVPILESINREESWGKLLRAQRAGKYGIVYYCDVSWGFNQNLGVFFLSLSPSASESLWFWAQEGKSSMISVGIGALEIAGAPTVLRANDLGSCVAVALYDSSQKKGGMAHVMLPQSPSQDAAKDRPGKYANTAVPALLTRLKAKGGVSAYLVGGANMPMVTMLPSGAIGAQNADTLRAALKACGASLRGERTGGTQARTIELLTATGEVRVTQGQTQHKEKLE